MDKARSVVGSYPVTGTLPATLYMPGTASEDSCIPSTEFVSRLVGLQGQIAEMITVLRAKKAGERFALDFEFTFDPKGSTGAELITGDGSVTTVGSTGGSLSKFTLRCYCNG